jgi:hypothetical protein
MKAYWFAIPLLLFVAFRFAQPIEDGDLFWHMKYASQMVERGTLRTDHSLYSWMPASNDVVYCAWTGELLFLGLWKVFGIAGIFALRYACVVAVAGMLALYARRCGLLDRPEAWLAILMVLLGSVVATLPKPEMLSLVLWNAMVFCWFGALSARSRPPWIYAIPAIMLVWVNTHGGFLLAAPLLAINVVAGFLLFPRRDAAHLAVATGLCGVATVVNPYGIVYPLQLLEFALGRGNHPDLAWNNAFQPSFHTAGTYLRLPELLAWMALAIVALLIRAKGRERWGIAILFVAYVPLYLLYVRSTFLLPAIFGYGALYLLSRGPAIRGPGAVALASVAMLFLGGRAVSVAALHPSTGSWMGFGVGDSQPVDEAEFLAQNQFGPRIYNTYNAGGYLLWRLYPRDRVMVDARSFPYLGWFDELVQFQRSVDPPRFRAFLAKYPGDVALVDFQEDMTWRSFLATPGWRPAFYGPSAAVFVPAEKSPGPVRASQSVARLRNGETAVKVFAFAAAAGDYSTAWNVLAQMRGSLSGQMTEDGLAFAVNYQAAHQAMQAHDYAAALNRFTLAYRQRLISGQDTTILNILRALQKVDPAGGQAAILRTGLEHLTRGPAL